MIGNGSVILACAIGITVICVGVAALAAIDGLAAINRPEILSKVPLAFVFMVSAIVGVGIVYLMVQALLAMGNDYDYGD